MTHNPASSHGSPIEAYLQKVHERYAGYTKGKVADYIPELAKADPNWFGICIATRDGHVYEIGDTRQHFSIQSISKALAYGLALEDRGEEHVLSRISVEPSGEAFNAISLRPGTGAPLNPMINAGAIATDAQVNAADGKSRIQRIAAYLSACAGRALHVDRAVYKSESDTGHRNRAIGWMLRNFNILEEDPTEVLETYFQQCAIRVTCRDLALMGATLANHGRNPLTREQAIAPAYVDNILSVMASCGMYDYSGEWLYRVGLPAKSGVTGGILAVLPGQLGIGVFSPPLDEQGNSARGIQVCGDLSRDFGLHLFGTGSPQSCLRTTYDGSQVSSRRRRVSRVRKALSGSGHRIRVLELQGEAVFSTFEPVVRAALKHAPYCQYMVLDLRSVTDLDEVSLRLAVELREALKKQGVSLYACHTERFSRQLSKHGFPADAQFQDEDAALEHCENELLQEIVGDGWDRLAPTPLEETHLLSDLSGDDIQWLAARVTFAASAAGDQIIRAGETADRLYVLTSGTVAVRLPSETGGLDKRIDVYVSGMTFGEMAFLDGSPRSANVEAMQPVTYFAIDRALFDLLERERPLLKIRLLEKLSRQMSVNVRSLNAKAYAQ